MKIVHQELAIMCELVNEMKLCYKFQALDIRQNNSTHYTGKICEPAECMY